VKEKVDDVISRDVARERLTIGLPFAPAEDRGGARAWVMGHRCLIDGLSTIAAMSSNTNGPEKLLW
jgi:hypothetical protein